MLALNDGKTEVLWFSSRFKDTAVRSIACDEQTGNERVSATDSVQNLGFDNGLDWSYGRTHNT